MALTVASGQVVKYRDIASIADLRNYTPKMNNEVVNVLGYYQGSHTGGGEFYYDGLDTTTPDNSGTTIVTSTGSRWKRIIKTPIVLATWFGAKGDYVIGAWGTPGTGTDDSSSIQSAIDYAITQGYEQVMLYQHHLITKTLNLNGSNAPVIGAIPGSLGVCLLGSGMDNTTLFFKPSTSSSAAVLIPGGSGYHTARAIRDLTIHPTSDSLYTGVGLRLEGACFTQNYRVAIMKFAIGVHYYNSTRVGTFTEYNSFYSSRFHRNLSNTKFEVNGGDNSFHGNSFYGGQFQIKTNQDLGDGNTTAGIGMELVGAVGTPAYYYDSHINTSFFGGPGAVAFKITRTNTDNLVGDITAEGSLICQQVDSTSSFEFKGGLWSIAGVTFDINTEPTTGKAAAFIFSNRTSNTSTFTSPRLTGLSPSQVPLYLADTTDGGGRVGLFRATGTNIDSPYLTCTGSAGNGIYFGYTAGSQPLQGFVPGIKMSYDGGTFSSYATSFIIANATTGIRLTGSAVEPQVDNTLSLGSNSFRYTSVYAVNSTISTSDATRKQAPRDPKELELKAFYEIAQLPWVWIWLEKYQTEGDQARLHSGPTVQAAIEIMDQYGLDWKNYSVFCYDSWEEVEEHVDSNTGKLIPYKEAGEIYSFRKEELLLWITRATLEKQKELEKRIKVLEE